MKRIIFACVAAALIAIQAPGGISHASSCSISHEDSDIGDTREELAKLRADHRAKQEEAAGEEAPSDAEEMAEILEAESTSEY